MKDTITEYTFVTDMTREGYGFSRAGAMALFEYLVDLELACEADMEYDPVGLRCEFTEYSDLEEIKDNHIYASITDLEDLHDHTLVIEFDGGIITQDF